MAQEEAKPADGAAPAAAKAPSPWIPVIAVLVLMPVISFAATQFLIMPRMLSMVGENKPHGEEGAGGDSHGAKAESHGGKEAKPAAADHHGGKESKESKGKEGKGGESTNGKFSFDFENVVVNLSGSLGTKYLKTSFTLYSSNANLKKLMEENKKQLMDVAINVLSSRSMADLEAAGAKNVVRNDLMANFNEALHSDLVEQIFYTEFVVQ